MKRILKKTNKKKNRKPAKAAAPDTGEVVHFTARYLVDPQHPVTVNVIGCGGTGSQVLNSLARMNSALIALGHPGIYVRAIDPDRVTAANMGRQLFSPADVGIHKCVTLIGRINRFFGYDWEAIPVTYDGKCDVRSANITISCVDTGKARKDIKEKILAEYNVVKEAANTHGRSRAYHQLGAYRDILLPFERPYYWMDFGNMMDRGQIVIGTMEDIHQPKSEEFKTLKSLPTVDKYHPEIFKDVKGEDQGPSCSLAEALGKQDLFINTNLANMGMGILWKMFRELRIKYHGLYLNLETMSVNPIKIK